MDLSETFQYIAETLKQPDTAARLYEEITSHIFSLRTMPQRHVIVQNEYYASQSIRKMPIENYLAFYAVNEDTREVYVLRVLYNRRDWEHLL